jgi:amino acid permease
MNFSFLSSIFFAFPIMFFSCRNNFIAIFKLVTNQPEKKAKNWRDEENVDEEVSEYTRDEGREERRRKAKLRFLAFTAVIYVVIVGVALGVDDIEAVFNVVGAICSSSVCILLPTFFYIRLVHIKNKSKTWKYYLSCAILAVLTPYCLFSVAALYINIE